MFSISRSVMEPSTLDASPIPAHMRLPVPSGGQPHDVHAAVLQHAAQRGGVERVAVEDEVALGPQAVASSSICASDID